VAVVQYIFIHKKATKNANNRTTQTTTNVGRVRAVPSLCEFDPGICLTLRKKQEKNSVRLQYTYTIHIKSNEELNDLYSSPNIVGVIKSRRMRWAGHVARMGEERVVYRVLVGKPERRKPLGRPRRRWVDNIRMDVQEVVCGYMDWIGLAQDSDRWRTFVSAVMNLGVP